MTDLATRNEEATRGDDMTTDEIREHATTINAWRAANPSIGISVSDEAIARILAENADMFQPRDPNRPPPHWRNIGDVPPSDDEPEPGTGGTRD